VVTLVLTLVCTQAPALRVTVIDVSDADAIYEDVSRGLAEEVVKTLAAAGLDARRVDESELPEGGCKVGPCLGQVVKEQKAHVLVALDAKELDKKKIGIGLTALWRDGSPLSGARYTLKVGQKKVPKELTAFATDVLARGTKKLPPAAAPDAGRAP
jgi:hypothetical protein